jgi:hypothetical protein
MERRGLLLIAPALFLTAGGCSVSLRRSGDAAPSGSGAAPSGSGAAPSGSGAAPSGDGVPRIGVDEAHSEVTAGRAFLVDVRSQQAYRLSRAAGAILLPLEQIEQAPPAAARALPAGQRPILYCT